MLIVVFHSDHVGDLWEGLLVADSMNIRRNLRISEIK